MTRKTKAELEIELGVSAPTLINDIKLANLSTKQRDYSEEEVREIKRIRKMFESGKTKKEIEEEIAIKEQSSQSGVRNVNTSTNSDNSNEIEQGIRNSVYNGLGNSVMRYAQEFFEEPQNDGYFAYMKARLIDIGIIGSSIGGSENNRKIFTGGYKDSAPKLNPGDETPEASEPKTIDIEPENS